MSYQSPVLPANDDITFEVLLLKQLAARRPSGVVSGRVAPALLAGLKESSLWSEPDGQVRPARRVATHWKAAILAAVLSVAALRSLPASADPQVKVTLSVIDARTGRPIGGARVLGEHGEVLGMTGADGRLMLQVPAASNEHFTVEKPGYRSFPMIRTQLRDSNLIALHAAPQTGTAVVAQRPSSPPPHVAATPHVVPPAHPTPKPHPTVPPTPKPIPQAKRTEAPVPTHPPAPIPTPHPPKPVTKAAPSAVSGTGTYRVRPGDTLWAIAKHQYGDPYRWRVLFDLNRGVIHRPRQLQPGMVLKLPTHLAAVSHGHRHAHRITVRRGDSLWSLSQRYLGDGERWNALYAANRRIVHNPRLIQPGMHLNLP